MYDYKTIITIIAVILNFVAYFPYVRDIFRGKTTPHVFTWFIWGLVTAIIFALQLSGGAGIGSWITGATALTCFFVFLLGFRNGNKNITRSDIMFLILSLTSLFLWLVVKQPVLSVILACMTDMLGFIPTIRKSWNDPYSETISLYGINIVKHGISILALQQYSVITWLYPVTWTIANAVFTLILIIRRKQISKIL